MKITPEVVFWTVGEEASAKTIDLAASADMRVKVSDVQSTDPRIKAKIEIVEEDKTYKVVITPEETTEPFLAVMSIKVRVLPNREEVFTAYAQVRHVKSSQSKLPVGQK